MARKSEAAFSIWQTSPAAALPGDPFQFGSPGLNNWQEWRCQTDPTDAQSALRLLSPTVTKTNVLLTWQSVAGANYFLQRSTNLAAPTTFATIVTNIPGQAGTTTYTDTNAVGAGAAFYRTGVGN